MKQRGFTLLEVLVATTIMGMVVIGLLSAISGSLRNASRLTEKDRAALLARAKMDELLLDPHLPRLSPIEGRFAAALMGGVDGGWRARVTLFDSPPMPAPGLRVLDRIELEVWWNSPDGRKQLALESYRTHILTPEEAALAAAQVPQ